ncbi:unnamed protein product [Sphagnum compactum]
MCGSGNPIDDCWRCDFNWESPRQSLADCVTGFGKNSIGVKNGQIHVVTDDTDYDVINPAPATLRYGAVKSEPLWIVFARNMMITLQEELVMNSFKTIDGRDHNVHIAGGACLTFQYVSKIIILGVHIHDCKSTGHAVVRGSPTMETASMCLQPVMSGWTIATSPTATTASLTPFMAPRPSPFPTTILPITIR